MGKLSDALEKHKKEKTIKSEMLPSKRINSSINREVSQTISVDKITSNKVNNKLVVVTAPDSHEAESFRLLRAQILFLKDRERPRTIMVTSAIPGDGKTFVAANLAASIAMGIDEYVLLVDCDMRRSNLHEMFGLSNSVGLHEYLKEEKQLSDLLIKTSINKLSLLPAGSAPHNPSELLASSAMKSFLKKVRARYDDRIIILDTPPSQGLPETNIISNFVDGIIFIVMENKTPRDMIKKAIESFEKDKVLGMVINGHKQFQNRYEKYYNQYYK